MALFVAISKWNSLLTRHIQNNCGCSIIVHAEVAMGTPNSPRCLHGPKPGNLQTAASPLGYVLISFFLYFSSQRKKQNIEIMQPSGIFSYLVVIWALRCLCHLGHHSFFPKFGEKNVQILKLLLWEIILVWSSPFYFSCLVKHFLILKYHLRVIIEQYWFKNRLVNCFMISPFLSTSPALGNVIKNKAAVMAHLKDFFN